MSDETATAAATATDEYPLFEPAEAERFRNAWIDVQSAFVDDPGQAVAAADSLVGAVLEGVHAAFQADRLMVQRTQLERDGQLSTEDLRNALQSYRSFLDRLLRV